MRLIIPETEQIVALDTCVARELCYSEPPWVSTFEAMRQEGYHFCLSDILVTEILNQFETGQITPVEYGLAIQRLNRFVSLTLPILPRGEELYQMAGIGGLKESATGDPALPQAFWIAFWQWFKSLRNPGQMHSTPISFTYQGEPCSWSYESGGPGTTLQNVRNECISSLEDCVMQKSDCTEKCECPIARDQIIACLQAFVDRQAECSPPLSQRLDLFIKDLAERVVQRNRSKSPYNPKSRKRRNDGIDILLEPIFLLPCFGCTLDTKFIARFNSIDSFQKAWLVTPEELKEQWDAGCKPRTMWPGEIGDSIFYSAASPFP